MTRITQPIPTWIKSISLDDLNAHRPGDTQPQVQSCRVRYIDGNTLVDSWTLPAGQVAVDAYVYNHGEQGYTPDWYALQRPEYADPLPAANFDLAVPRIERCLKEGTLKDRYHAPSPTQSDEPDAG